MHKESSAQCSARNRSFLPATALFPLSAYLTTGYSVNGFSYPCAAPEDSGAMSGQGKHQRYRVYHLQWSFTSAAFIASGVAWPKAISDVSFSGNSRSPRIVLSLRTHSLRSNPLQELLRNLLA